MIKNTNIATSLFVLIACLVFVSGCITTKRTPLLRVDNAGSVPIRDVVVRYHGEPCLSASTLAAGERSKPFSAKIAIPSTVTVEWSEKDGSPMTSEVAVISPLRDTRPCIVIEIKDANTVRAFVLWAIDNSGHLIPWGQADWDGSFSLPGMPNE